MSDRTHGSVLFADISGFTRLTESLRNSLGTRLGAEELTKHLNAVDTALITEVEKHGGSVLGFAGDAITCWFDDANAEHLAQRGDILLDEATVKALGDSITIREWRSDAESGENFAAATRIEFGGVEIRESVSKSPTSQPTPSLISRFILPSIYTRAPLHDKNSYL
ncbi:MAG: hypothetical protein HYZ22_00325 [Chloroflexi bacterium]|nr:hypothetical protein [Chloroflexota bacterium]